MRDKQDLFYSNKKNIEQAWKLLEVAMELVNEVVDVTDSSFSNAYEVHEKIRQANDDLYKTYEDNIKEHSDK